MADLTAADVTVTLKAQDKEFLGIGKIVTFPDIAFGDGSKTYPTGGVPLPGLGNFGMKREIKGMLIGSIDGLVYKYDKANHKLLIFWGDYSNASDGPLVEFVGAPAATALELTVIGQ